MITKIPCPECSGAGRFLVTREMAIDAGDSKMQGEWLCQKCGGDGYFLVEEEDGEEESRQFQ